MNMVVDHNYSYMVVDHNLQITVLYWARALVLYTSKAPPARRPARVIAQIKSPVVPAKFPNNIQINLCGTLFFFFFCIYSTEIVLTSSINITGR